jgi:hypothetical protein
MIRALWLLFAYVSQRERSFSLKSSDSSCKRYTADEFSSGALLSRSDAHNYAVPMGVTRTECLEAAEWIRLRRDWLNVGSLCSEN